MLFRIAYEGWYKMEEIKYPRRGNGRLSGMKNRRGCSRCLGNLDVGVTLSMLCLCLSENGYAEARASSHVSVADQELVVNLQSVGYLMDYVEFDGLFQSRQSNKTGRQQSKYRKVVVRMNVLVKNDRSNEPGQGRDWYGEVGRETSIQRTPK